VPATIWLRGERLKEQPGVVGGVVIYVYIIVVQGETMTMRPRATIIGVEASEVDSLFTHLLGLVFHADIRPRHHPYVGHLKSMCCPIICWPAGSRGTSMVPFGGIDAGWKPGGSKISKKSSLLSDNRAASSSEDLSTTAGCREVTCMRRAYTNSLQMELLLSSIPLSLFAAHQKKHATKYKKHAKSI